MLGITLTEVFPKQICPDSWETGRWCPHWSAIVCYKDIKSDEWPDINDQAKIVFLKKPVDLLCLIISQLKTTAVNCIKSDTCSKLPWQQSELAEHYIVILNDYIMYF